MKYIILENQFDNLIFEYLSHEFNPHVKEKVRAHPRSVFLVKDGKYIADIVYDENIRIWVVYSIWERISNMFNLTYEEIEYYIRKWFLINNNIKVWRALPHEAEEDLFE